MSSSPRPVYNLITWLIRLNHPFGHLIGFILFANPDSFFSVLFFKPALSLSFIIL